LFVEVDVPVRSGVLVVAAFDDAQPYKHPPTFGDESGGAAAAAPEYTPAASAHTAAASS